ncbi:MAG: RhuM family protein [Thiopseudomonas sp.]
MAGRPNMGLTRRANALQGKILKTDVTVVKNYLSKDELDSLGRTVNAYLELAENRTRWKIPMMKDWAKRLLLSLMISPALANRARHLDLQQISV